MQSSVGFGPCLTPYWHATPLSVAARMPLRMSRLAHSDGAPVPAIDTYALFGTCHLPGRTKFLLKVRWRLGASSSMAEQRTLNPQVQGSNPWGRTKK